VAIVAATAAAAHLTVATRYGWFPDEFYYVICGRHPAWGYVDQPPLVPLLARAATTLPPPFGGLLMLRLFAIAAHVGCIVLAAVLAAEFGGRRVAQVIGAATVASSPGLVAASSFFGTTVIDQLIWLAVIVLVARALRLATTPAWLLVGAAAGVGLENKQTAAVLLVGVAAGLVMFRREVLRTRGPWLAAGLAILLAAPNLVWNATHGWPNLQFAQRVSQYTGGPLGSLTQLPLVAVYIGPLLIVLAALGIRWLSSPTQREHRWVLSMVAVAFVVFTATGGRPYYSVPAFAALFAAGAVRVESAHTNRLPKRWTATLAVSFVGAVLAFLPVLPVSAASVFRPVNPYLTQSYGWPQFTKQVVSVSSSLPAHVPIFTGYYIEAGALTILGPAADLRHPVYSAHNQYALWGPPKGRPDTVLCLGDFPIDYLRDYWSEVTTLAPINIRNGDKIWETGITMYLCRQPRGTWAEMWPSLSHFN